MLNVMLMEAYRVKDAGNFSSNTGDMGGVFRRQDLRMIVGVGDGWEHVSVSKQNGTIPTWSEMCLIKSWFWEAEDTVMQLHPPQSQYLSYPGVEVLHMWRPLNAQIPSPPLYMV